MSKEITKVTDEQMLAYMVRESGKTKEEMADEIKERFWFEESLVAFLSNS
jgi:hypothetical protein